MCGIAGILRFDKQPVEQRVLSGMLDRLAHRGQDHCGMVFGPMGTLSRKVDIALGHRRLSIIDLSIDASQPMSYDDGRLWITFNGEIYNYIELRKELKTDGYLFRTNSDTEVILAAYNKWGEECVSRLNGMFAFALWDDERGKLFCARDHFGIKPFYYYQSSGFIAFASESKALQQFHENTIDQDALASYLLCLYVPVNRSIFQGVSKLLPSHTMTIEPSGRIAQKRYWRISQVADVEDTPSTRQALEKHLMLAVNRQLRSDVPVGALLSGGVDSGMVVALAASQGTQIHTYSVGFEGQVNSELPAAAEIARYFKTKHHEALITANESIVYLDSSLAHLCEPIADPAIVPSYLLSSMAAGDGVKVLLSGTGGDEIFGGYERYAGNNNFRRQLFTRMPEWVRTSIGRMLPAHSKLGARLRNTCIDMLFNTGGNFSLCSAMFRDNRQLGCFLRRLEKYVLQPSEGERHLLYKLMWFDMNVYLPDEILLLFDQMTMAHTVEGRVPLLDVDVVEAAFRFPPGSHVSKNKTKILFREIASNYLGESHVWRKKQGFAGPVPWWVGKNLQLFRDVAMSTRDIPGLEGIVKKMLILSKENYVPGWRDAHAMFILYCLRRWYDKLE